MHLFRFRIPKSASRRRHSTRSLTPRLELLERRCCLTVDVTLLVAGTIEVEPLEMPTPGELQMAAESASVLPGPHFDDDATFAAATLEDGLLPAPPLPFGDEAAVAGSPEDHDSYFRDPSFQPDASTVQWTPVAVQVDVEIVELLVRTEGAEPMAAGPAGLVVAARPIASLEFAMLAWTVNDADASAKSRDHVEPTRERTRFAWALLQQVSAGGFAPSPDHVPSTPPGGMQAMRPPGSGPQEADSKFAESRAPELPVSAAAVTVDMLASQIAQFHQKPGDEPQTPGKEEVSDSLTSDSTMDLQAKPPHRSAGGGQMSSRREGPPLPLAAAPDSADSAPSSTTSDVRVASLDGAVLSVTFGQPLTRVSAPWPVAPESQELNDDGGERTWMDELGSRLLFQSHSSIFVGAAVSGALTMLLWPSERRHSDVGESLQVTPADETTTAREICL